ncbi:MAG: hypothetical protein HC862_12705 [Scytonema sp. RU_4_4]|nr:hypothetical protein [Scytonema sp. RU_4_4]NJR75492.1 hypothetical protein [Scytonema sp. CRU_2_7]
MNYPPLTRSTEYSGGFQLHGRLPRTLVPKEQYGSDKHFLFTDASWVKLKGQGRVKGREKHLSPLPLTEPY